MCGGELMKRSSVAPLAPRDGKLLFFVALQKGRLCRSLN